MTQQINAGTDRLEKNTPGDAAKGSETHMNRSADYMKMFTEILKQLSWLTQFGLSLLTPTVLCIGVCYLLCSRLGLGAWIYIPGFILGLGSSAMVAWKFYKWVMKDEKKAGKKKDRSVSFNEHSF